MGDYDISKKERELLEKIYEKLESMGKKPKKLDGKDKLKALCPFHDDHEPSFFIYEYLGNLYFKCFGCGKHGSIWKLAKELKILPEKTGKPEIERREMKPDVLERIIIKAHKALRIMLEKYDPNAEIPEESFFVQRGFLKAGQPYKDVFKLIERYHFGIITPEVVESIPESRIYWGRLIIPYFDINGEIPIWFNARAIYDDAFYEYQNLPTSKYYNPGGNTRLYNAQASHIALERGWLLVVEGELDTISVIEATGGSVPVVGFPGGGVSGKKLEEFFKKVAESNIDVYILTDPDEAGKKHASHLRKIIRKYGGIAKEIRLLTPENDLWKGDINDALIEFGKEKLREMIDDALERSDTNDIWFFKNLHIILKKEKERPTYPTGIGEIDELLGGGYRAGLHVIGGITAVGKTAFALHIAKYNALQGNPVLYFSYEQSKIELWGRIITSVTDEIKYFDIKDGSLNKPLNELETADVLMKIAGNLKILEGDSGMINDFMTLYTVDEIAQEAERVKRKTGKPPLVIIDYVQRMPASEELKRKDLRERIDFIVTGLQTHVARTIGSPVIALSSISRASYSSNDQSGLERKLSSFKESGGIEYTGYTVALLRIDKDVEETEQVVYFDLLKNRETGKVGTVALLFTKTNNKWEDYSDG